MSSTPFDVYVFDFDGTLVDSAEAKRRGFFEVFPAHCAAAVAAILERDPDGSRHHVIPLMIDEAKRLGLQAAGLDAEALIIAYGRKVDGAVASAPAMAHAEQVLQMASSDTAAYVASMTPQQSLLEMLARRGWLPLLKGAYGFPHRKQDVVAQLLEQHGIEPSRLMVVGDGVSDRLAAEHNGCAFYAITSAQSLMTIPGLEMISNV